MPQSVKNNNSVIPEGGERGEGGGQVLGAQLYQFSFIIVESTSIHSLHIYTYTLTICLVASHDHSISAI